MSSDGLDDLEARAAKIVKAVQRLDKRIQNKGRLLRYVRSEMAAVQKKKDKQQDCAEDGALSAMECSNLPYYQAIVEMCHSVVACGVLRRFSADDAQVTFEVTAGLATGAVAWIKCFARSQHRLEHDHILDLAKSCLHIAKMNIIGDATPMVCFRFFGGLPPSLAAAVSELGIDVAEGAVPPQDPSRTTAGSINLDTTTLIALTSNLSHGQVGWTFKDAELEKQAAMEAKEPVLQQLASMLGGRRLVVSSTALETYKELVEKMAGGYERKRADEIVAALNVAEAERPDGFLTSRKVSEDMLKVVGVGLKHGIPTCMANTKAMRSIQDQRQGVHMLQHMPRALTEGAQSKKTSKRNDRRHPMQAEELQKLFDYILGVGEAPVVGSTDPDPTDSLSEAADAQEDGADASGSELNDPRSLDAGPQLDLTSICACVLADETFREKCAQCLGELKQACKEAFSGPEFQMKPFDWCPEPVLTAFGSTVQGTAIKTSDLDVRLSFEQFEVRAKDRQVLYLTALSKLHGTAFELDQLIATASLPLLRLWYRQLQVDITMGLTDDLEVDKVLATILDSAAPAVRNMVCLAKAFAKTNDLLNAYSGYLNAVSWVCLCIAFLQEECDDALQAIPLDVCTFSRFLQFVAKCCRRQRHISLGPSRSKGPRHGRATLFIEHPTNPNRNLAQCLRQSPAKKTAEACERVAKQLRGCRTTGALEEILRGLLGVRKRKADKDPEKEMVDAGHLCGLRGLSEDLGTTLRVDVAKAASAFFKTFQIEGNQGGAPAASIDTTASGAHLVQELLSNKKLTDVIYDILMKDARVGKETHVSTEGGLVQFSVEDISVDVECQYDLRLSSFGYKETGNVKARLFGASMLLDFPIEGSGPGGCHFGKGLDLEVLNATSDHDALNVAITDILSNNMLDLHTEIVQEMESGLCRNLLEPRAEQPTFMHKPLGKGESMWPLVLGTIFLFFAMLVAAFLAGRQSVYFGFCSCLSRCCGCLAPQAWSHTEGHTSSEESNSDVENQVSWGCRT
ncbi:unnamed protein product [Symbiodinium sp. CCMP2592]|nr:unnamed protein product [Symbiodinium sp. CCMP2592]